MITRDELNKVREKASGLKALVIGDAMLDRYIYGTVDRISPEAPVPVLSHQYAEEKAGGAANVALNLAAWGCRTSLIGMTGDDPNAIRLEQFLEANKIEHHFYKSKNRPTTVKTRIVAASHHLLRIDEESAEFLSGDEEKMALDLILDIITNKVPDLVILEDYNKGLLTEKIISAIIKKCKESNTFVAVDPKDKNFFTYSGVNLFKPNLREASQAAHKPLDPGDCSRLSKEWRNQMNVSTIAITLGGKGIYLQNEVEDVQVLPERSIDVVDVCGAGDAVVCSLALGIISGLDLKTSGSLANLTGAYVCSHSGVVTVDVREIYKWI